ncbi:MAG: hypothetical protein ACPHYC_00315 [Schleiferiaceae bacterium]
MKSYVLMLLCMFIVPNVLGADQFKIYEEADSAFSTKHFHLLELADEEIMYDAYQVKTEVSERTLIGEAKLTFTQEDILLQFELPDYFVSTSFDFIIPDKEIRIMMKSICKRYGNEYSEATAIKFFGAGSAISFYCGNKQYLLVEK